MTERGESPLRILFLSPFPPRLDGQSGGSRTIARLMLGLADRHRVGLLYFQQPGASVDDRLASRCDLIEAIPLSFENGLVHWSMRQLRVALGLTRGRPRWVSNWSDTGFEHRLHAVVRDWRPDVVQAESHVMGQYFRALQGPEVRRVLVQHEPGVVAAADLLGSRTGIARVLAAVEVRAWRRYETSIMRFADVVVTFTEQDRTALRALTTDPRIEVIPFGTDLPPMAGAPEAEGVPRLLFVGNFRHPPNVDAALHLARNIFPLVREVIAECMLDIVGAAPPRALRDLGSSSLLVTGRVADVQPYLNRADIVAVPLRLGGGMRVKVVEALAAGKPVVASPLAVAGLNVVDGEQLRIARDDAEFVSAVIELLRSPTMRRAMEASARKWAAAHLNPALTVSRYEELYRSLLELPTRQ